MLISQYKSSVTGILILFFFGYSCTKIDSTTLGKGLIPAVDNVHTFDTTLNVIATNFDLLGDCDTVRRNDLHALGIISNDPYFGKTNANIYLELKPDAYPFSFPSHDEDSLVIDSVVLVLKYAYSNGDSTIMQKVQVYELSNNFSTDTAYSTCSILEHENVLLGEKLFLPSALNDSIHAFSEDAANQLRIPIDKSIFEGFVENEETVFLSDSTFKEAFKGFAIVADESVGGQALNYFSLTSSETRLAIYFRTSKDDVKDTAMANFFMTRYSGESNSITRARDNAEITQHLSQPVNGDSLLYVQTSPGSYVTLTIPGLSGMSNRVIHRAALIVEQSYNAVGGMDEIFENPSFLFLDMKDTSIDVTYIPIPCDFNTNELQGRFSNFGGEAITTTDGAGHSIVKYVFNLSRYAQNVVTTGSNNALLRLRAPYYISNEKGYVDRCNQFIAPFSQGMNNIALGRIRLNGTNNTTSHIRLHVVYSTL